MNPYIVTLDDIRHIAETRTRIHRNHATQRQLSADYDLIGLLGEWEFARQTGLDLDTSVRPGGDSGIDFRTSMGTIDVKTYRKPYTMLREQDKNHADILVLAGVNGDLDRAKLLRWEYDTIMVQCRVMTRRGHKVLNHTKPATSCRPITELLELLAHDRIYEDPAAPRQMAFEMFTQGYGELPY